MADDIFCPQHPKHADWPYPEEANFPCRIWDANNIVYPPDEVNSIFMVRRMFSPISMHFHAILQKEAIYRHMCVEYLKADLFLLI